MSNPLIGVSADVAAILGQAQQKEELADQPRWKRNQVKRDAGRVKLTIDLTDNPWLEAAIREKADQEHAGVSSVAAWLLALGLEASASRTPVKRPSQSRQHSFDLLIGMKTYQ